MSLYSDRRDAGARLAELLLKYKHNRTLVLALPRGGVPVAFEVARQLSCPLDTIVVRKVGAPLNPEFAVGAIAPHGIRMLDPESVYTSGASPASVDGILEREEQELERRQRVYRSGMYSIGYAPNTIIVVDDGIATGLSAKAACRSVRKKYAQVRLVLAAPVFLTDPSDFSDHADEVAYLDQPEELYAVAQAYDSFPEVSDDEVNALLGTSGAL